MSRLCTHVINVTHLTNTYQRALCAESISSVKLSIRKDTFVKGENEMWKMPAKERIQTRIVAASAVKRVIDLLSVCPPTHLKMFREKETPISYYATQQSSLITEMWQNISGENLRLLHSKMLSIFGSTLAIFVNAHFLHCCVPPFCARLTVQLTIATSLCCYSFRAEFHKIQDSRFVFVTYIIIQNITSSEM